jgi:hypothetical protein
MIWATGPYRPTDDPRGDMLIQRLETLGHTRAFAPYWSAYVTTYNADGRVVVSPLSSVRSRAIDDQVSRDPHPVYVFPTTTDERTDWMHAQFRAGLAAAGIGFDLVRIPGYRIYIPDRKVLPGELLIDDRRETAT